MSPKELVRQDDREGLQNANEELAALIEELRVQNEELAIDINDRKQAEDKLRESEEKYRSLFESIDQGFCVIEVLFDAEENPVDFRLVAVNPAFEKQTGIKDAVGRRVKEIIPKLEEYWFQIYGKIALTGESMHFEYPAEQLHRYYDVRAWRVGKPHERKVAVLFNDLTERKRAEEALRASHERLKRVLEIETVGVMFWDVPMGCLTDANDAFLKMMGYSRDEVEARELTWQKLTPPEYHDASLAEIRKLRATGHIGPYEKEYLRKDGTRQWLLIAGSSLGGDTCVEFCVDIADRKRAEEERKGAEDALAAAKASAESANRAKDHFLAVLSHELRTPLTPVVMGVSMLQDKPGLSQDVRDTLEMVRQNVEMEARLIDDLLDVTRIARGKIELNRRQVELTKVIERAVEVCKPDIEARKLHFGVDIGPGAPYWINADPSRLQQVFWNLLKNAIKFTPHGGCVGIRCRPNGGHVSIEVNDSGIGIEPEALPRVFDAFEQAERSITRQFGGLGLGLAISKALVEMHDGEISAESRGSNKGATFKVLLPLSVPQKEATVVGPPRISIRPLRILLVEDHGVSAQMIRMVLKERGHSVEIAGDIATALDLAGRQPFELILSDLGLPDGSGHDLLRELRSRGHTFPAIALSGYGQEDDIRHSQEAGFATHLIKPASREAIEEAVACITAERTECP